MSFIPWADIESYAMKLGASTREVADFVSVHVSTVAALYRAGMFPNAYKVGGGKGSAAIRIPWADVEAFRQNQPRVCR